MADQARRAIINQDHLVAAAYFAAAAEMEHQVLALLPVDQERTRKAIADSMANLRVAAADARRQARGAAVRISEAAE
jgi:hypothetical protein